MHLPRWCSANEMYVTNSVRSHGELMRKLTYGFRKRVSESNSLKCVQCRYSFFCVPSTVEKDIIL